MFLAIIQESEYEDPDGLAPLTMTNDIDNEPSPERYPCYTDTYITNPDLPHEVLPPGIPAGCKCTGDECDPEECACAKIGPQHQPTYLNDDFKKDSL